MPTSKRLFVEPALLGAGIGRRLFEWATATARNLGAVRITIEADPGAVPFYERMGARQQAWSRPNPSPGGCCHACSWNWKPKRAYRDSGFVR